jgi:hypothetical protein
MWPRRGQNYRRIKSELSSALLPAVAHLLARQYTTLMPLQRTDSYLRDSLDVFRYYKKLAENAMAQCSDESLFRSIDAESNSIAIIVKHVAGNMRSRWTDFLTSDGEKPDRNRDTEFESPATTRADLMQQWEKGWGYVFAALEPLTDADIAKTVTIRGEAHSVMQAINRQIAHYSYHVGQIVFLAKHCSAANWKALTIPKKQSAAFNAAVASGEKSQR